MSFIIRSSKITSKFLVVILMALLPVQSLFAQGWLANWPYRSSVTVTNSVAAGLTDYQVQITLNNGNFDFAMAKTDGSDIRITMSDGTSIIPFWIENWTQGTTASIWVKVPIIPASGTATLYLYYGNNEATSSSNGTSTFTFFDDFESWSVTPRPSSWQDLATIPTGSADATASVFNKILYTFGGYGERPPNEDHVVLNTVYAYDPSTNGWTYKAPMPTSRWGMVSVESGGKIYVFGGQDQFGNGTGANEIYDPATDSWTSTALGNPLPVKDYGAEGVVHPDVIYFPGGKDGYNYWMMFTPYPPAAKENPSILRSQDGIRWTDNGISNPVISKGASGAWNDVENADPDFIYVAAINKWFMVWIGGEASDESRKIALAYSDDGKTWTQYTGAAVNGNINPVILSGTDNAGQPWEIGGQYHSSKTCTPTLFYENGTFYLYYAEEASGINRGKIGLATFSWNNSTNSVVGMSRNAGNPIIDLPDDAIFKTGGGHIDISKDLSSNAYRMYVCRELSGSANFELGLLTAPGLSGPWTSHGKTLARGNSGEWDDYHIYRSCPIVNSSGEIALFGNSTRMFYSAFGDIYGGTGIGIADIDNTSGAVVKFTGTGPKLMPVEISHQGLMGVPYGDKIHLFYNSFHFEYDPLSDNYVQKSPVPHPRTWATCAVVDNNIYLIGGYEVGSGGSNNNQMLNLLADSWEDKAPIPHARYGSIRENPVINGYIYVTHGWNDYWFYTANFRYNPVTDKWEQKGSANHPRDGVASGVIEGKLYVVGGRNVASLTYGLNFNEVYDPVTDDTWVPANPPSTWTTSGANFVFTDAAAKYQGNNGLIIRDPMDGSAAGLYAAETQQDFGSVFALDFNWNVTTIGGISEDPTTYPEATVRLAEDWPSYGSLYFYQNQVPTLRWLSEPNYLWTDLQTSTWDNWHKVTVVRNGDNSRVVFDGNLSSPLSMVTTGAGKARFGSIRSTQYVDNARVRKWSGEDPVTGVGIMEALDGQWNGSAGTDWNNSLNWSDGKVPAATVNVNIPPLGNQPVISSNAFCNNITINTGATLQITGTNTLTISGNWTNNGTFTANQSTVVFDGISPQIGAGEFFNLTMPGSGTKTFTSTAVISGTLISGSDPAFQPVTISTGASLTIRPSGKATVGALTNNGTLNLYSNATGIASLILDSYSDFGTENIQLYLSGGGNENENNWKWHYISSPVTSLPVSEVLGSGAGSANNLAVYDETYSTENNQHSAWFGFDGWNYQDEIYNGPVFGVLEIGRGYNYFNSGDATRTFGGPINSGTVSKNLSYSGATNNLERKGWNLIGNPYTASISWLDFEGLTSGIDNAIYFTKDNGFASFVNGVGVPEGTYSSYPSNAGILCQG